MSWVVGLGALMGLGAWGRVYGMVFLLGVAGACVSGYPGLVLWMQGICHVEGMLCSYAMHAAQ